jgi:predicted amidohydrolase YtcJ
LKHAADLAEVADVIGEYAASLPTSAAVTALRLDDETLAEGRLPDRRSLDGVAGDRPVVAIRYCGHIAVANTPALEAAGIGPDTPDPPGGVIDRDPSGVPTGVLRETAVAAVTKALAPLDPPLDTAEVADSINGLASLGITGMGGIVSVRQGLWGGGASELEVLLAAAGDLTIPIGVLVIARTPGELEEAADRIEEMGGELRFLGLKAFSDGSLGGHTAALRAPYHDRPDRIGTDRLDAGWAADMAAAALRLGGQVAVHAIGDAAVGKVLDLFEGIIRDGADPSLLRIEHASVVTAEDVARFADLGVTAVVQPAFLASESAWLEKRLGPDRLAATYAFRTLLEAGVPVAGSSDCPVEPPSPVHGMAAARHRGGLVPEESLTGAEALDLFTHAAAAAIGESAGLAPGAPATLTVLDGDPVTATPEQTAVMASPATWVDGKRLDRARGRTWAG